VLALGVAIAATVGALVLPTTADAAEPASTTTVAPAAGVRMAALAPRVPEGATKLGAVAPTKDVTITVALRPTHEADLDALLDDLYDPASPNYGRWLGSGEFTSRFGPDPAQVAEVTGWLEGQGLHATPAQGMAVSATGDAQDVARALGVTFSNYRTADGDTGYIASDAPLVPRVVADGVAAIVGLNSTVQFESNADTTPHAKLHPSSLAADPRVAAAPRGAPAACSAARSIADGSFWTPDQVGRFYRVHDLFAAGLTGKGKTIALLELGRSRPADTAQFFKCFGLKNHVQVKRVNGGAGGGANASLEAEIDIQEAATQAPGAKIVSYEAPNTATGEYNAYNAIVNDNIAHVVSTSWGKCEALLLAEPNGAAFINALHTVFQQAAAQGQTVFAASGDTGSEDCYDGTAVPPSEALQVDSPANDPFVTGVGGTALEEPGVEPVWNDCGGLAGDSCAAGGSQAGGGGQSTVFKRPKWQPLAKNATCATCRGVPDISGNAGVGETFFASGGWTAVGGTSIAAPMMAGIAADIDQGCRGGRIGDFAPRLAALAAKRVYGTALTDVNTGINWTNFTIQSPGSNDLTRNHSGTYKTTKGFDLASGYGAPIASGLACPQVLSMTPNHGKAGTRVTLRGVGLERATIKFGAAKARVVSAAPKSAVVIVPKGKGIVNVRGTSPFGTGVKAAPFSYIGPDRGLYRTVAANGHVNNFGGALNHGSPDPASVHAPIVGMAVDHSTGGYWLVAADGNVYNFNAPFFGDAGATPLNQPIVGMAANENGDGYWLVARDGGIFAFGKAKYYGSTGGIHLNQPIVGITANAKTGGYWLVASDGGIFAFHAPFHGSTGAIHLNKPIVGIAADIATGGYWLVASDGGVFAFHAPFFGSTGAIRLNQPIVGMAATADARGYRFVAADGGVFNFGDAKFGGSSSGSGVGPIVAISPAQ
jgi:hypothetical protein